MKLKAKAKTKAPKVNRALAIKLAALGVAGDFAKLSLALRDIERQGDVDEPRTWEYFARRFRLWIESGLTGPVPFSIFAEKGNKKLPFFAFSSLPGFDCPGAGACLFGDRPKGKGKEFWKGWCYSFTAWRYPAAFLRQLQNSILLRFGNQIIESAWERIPANKILRLYVDGDFYSLATLRFWMRLVRERPDLDVYGYSKSWQLFLALDKQGFAWPSNYMLNLSSGSKHGDALRARMEKLSCVRGDFVAVPVNRKWIDSKAYQDKGNEGSKEYRAEVLQVLRETHPNEKHFACPGNCGNCIPNGKQACGNKDLSGVVIGIGIHA